MKRICRAFSATLPMWIGILGGFFIMCGGGNGHMEDAALWGILATMFGVLVAGIVELVKSFKDGAVTKTIKDDTADIKPKVDDIKTSVGKTNEILLDAVKPTMQSVSEQTKKIDTVVSSMTRFEGLVQGSKVNEIRPDVLLAQVISVYEERDLLKQRLSDAQKQIKILTAENHELKSRCYDLQNANDDYEYEP